MILSTHEENHSEEKDRRKQDREQEKPSCRLWPPPWFSVVSDMKRRRCAIGLPCDRSSNMGSGVTKKERAKRDKSTNVSTIPF